MATGANRPRRRPTQSAAPVLLPTFFVAIVAVVLAVIALNRIQSGVADTAAVLLIVLLAGLLLAAILRLLRQDGDDRQDRPGDGDAP